LEKLRVLCNQNDNHFLPADPERRNPAARVVALGTLMADTGAA
jgi:hypothetical protein